MMKSTNSGRNCEFCKEPEHFGVCEAMRLAQDKAISERRPVPNPLVRN